MPMTDKIHSNERKEFLISYVITFVYASLFARTSPVSDRAAAELLSFLPAELWPRPTKGHGDFFFYPQPVLTCLHAGESSFCQPPAAPSTAFWFRAIL